MISVVKTRICVWNTASEVDTRSQHPSEHVWLLWHLCHPVRQLLLLLVLRSENILLTFLRRHLSELLSCDEVWLGL